MEVATEMSSSMYEPKTAKKVYLYRNGVINADPKCLVVNQKQVRDFGSFLNRVTSGLKAPVAIRNIYTPAGGHKVKSLDSLESGRYYVAGGAEQFKKIKYGSSSPQKLLSRRPPRKEFSVPSRMQQAVVAPARYKKPVEKPFVIHVFRNGDFRYRGARVLLPRRIMGSWEHVLEIVTEKADLFTPAKRLCTLDGHIVHAVSELQDGGKYVVLEGSKPFQRVAYCATDDSRALMHTFPKAAIRLHRRLRRKPTHNDDGMVSDPGKTPVPLLSQSLKQQRLDRRKSRPMAGRKNKEAREKAIEDHRADSIFGGSPTRELDAPIDGPLMSSRKQEIAPTQHPLSKVSTIAKDTNSSEDTDSTVAERKPGVFHAADNGKQTETKQEYIEDTQGDTVFKAKAQRTDMEDAEVIIESHDTEVERPLDLEEAEEVEEEKGEELEGEGETASDNKVPELQAPPQHNTSIDLSLNRTQPTTTTADNNTTTTKQIDSDTLPAGGPGIANDDPTLSTGGTRSAQPSRHSQVIDDSNNGGGIKPEDAQEIQQEQGSGNDMEGVEKSSVTQPEESTTKGDSIVDGGAGDGEVSKPPEEEIIEEDIITGAKEEVSEAIKDTAIEEVSEKLEQQEPSPPTGEPEVVEPQVTEGNGGEQGAVESTTEPLDTSVPEEIVEEVDRSAQEDIGSQNEDEPTTTFVVEES